MIKETIISCTCCVVHPCFVSFNFFLILIAIRSGSLEGLPLLGLLSSPSIPSSRYLASQLEVHVLLLRSSLATRAGSYHLLQPWSQAIASPLDQHVIPFCTELLTLPHWDSRLTTRQSRSMNRAKALSVQRIRQLYQQYVTTVILIGLVIVDCISRPAQKILISYLVEME